MRGYTLGNVAALALIFGCQQLSDDVEISGNVSWNGKPMPSGMIVLQPENPRQAPAGGKIVDGQFRLRTKPGKMRVEIDAVRKTNERDPDTGTLLGEMYVPARYNRETTLLIKVTRDGKKHFEFPLSE
ncbi:MAG: hypothetical protein WD738_12310 [Pirellulales bacterium]